MSNTMLQHSAHADVIGTEVYTANHYQRQTLGSLGGVYGPGTYHDPILLLVGHAG